MRLWADLMKKTRIRRWAGVSQSSEALGKLLLEKGSREESIKVNQAALVVARDLIAQCADQLDLRDEAASRMNNIGVTLAEADPKVGEAAIREAIAIHQKLVADLHHRSVDRLHLAHAHNNLGKLLSDQNRLPEAEKNFSASATLLEKLSQEFSKSAEYHEEMIGRNSISAHFFLMA